MTQDIQDPRRHPDGSIDHGFYRARAERLRRQARDEMVGAAWLRARDFRPLPVAAATALGGMLWLVV